jgi:sucrose-6F-phosphate phosphohydrolase
MNRGTMGTDLLGVKPIDLVSADLDGTLVGEPAATARFIAAWDALEPARRPLLVYNTGRNISDTRGLVAGRQLPEPDFIIGGVGTELHERGASHHTLEFREQFVEAWDCAVIEEIVGTIPRVTRQPSTLCSEFKSSWFWPRARTSELDALHDRLRLAGMAVHVDYSCRYFLDIVPASAGKGRALTWLCDRLGVSLSRVLVAGDSGNDISMFLLPGVKGVVVQNALPELLAQVLKLDVFVAQQSMADGVLEGLRHSGVLPHVSATSTGPLLTGSTRLSGW